MPLPPLLGAPAIQAEVRLVLDELIRNLSADYQKRVAGIPLKFETDPNELNAYAGCDEQGASYMAATQGMLDAIDGMAQTKATDELFGTQTYDAYTAAVIPNVIAPKGGSAALPLTIIPLQYAADPRRLPFVGLTGRPGTSHPGIQSNGACPPCPAVAGSSRPAP